MINRAVSMETIYSFHCVLNRMKCEKFNMERMLEVSNEEVISKVIIVELELIFLHAKSVSQF